jgi:hypothetical protein
VILIQASFALASAGDLMCAPQIAPCTGIHILIAIEAVGRIEALLTSISSWEEPFEANTPLLSLA